LGEVLWLTNFKFRDIGEGLTEGEIIRWLVKEGDALKEGAPLVEVETDKPLLKSPRPRRASVLKILPRERRSKWAGHCRPGEKGRISTGSRSKTGIGRRGG